MNPPIKIVYRRAIAPDKWFEIEAKQMDEMVKRILEIPNISIHIKKYHDDFVNLVDPSFGTETHWPDRSVKLMSTIMPKCESAIRQILIDVIGTDSGVQSALMATTLKVMGDKITIPENYIKAAFNEALDE